MKLTKLSIALYVALLFLSGVAVGAFGYRLYTVAPVSASNTPPNAAEYRKKYLNEMQLRLKLNPDQVTKLDGILDDTRSKFHAVRQRTKPEFEAIRTEQVERVNSILSAEQRAEYEKMRKERDAREAREKQTGRGSGPGF